MHSQRLLFLVLNVIGGAAVLGSYARGISTHPNAGVALWGHVPAALRPLYTVSMFTATAGYLALAYFLFFCVDAAEARVGAAGYGAFNLIVSVILVPSALWMGLTFAYLANPTPLGWAAVRGVLLLAGLGALALLALLARLRPITSPLAHWIAIAGAVAFAFQTAVLDALVWPAYFRGE
jgi:hypothetical protein